MKTLRFPDKSNALHQVTRKSQTSGNGPELPDSQARCLLPHTSTLPVFPSSDLHYQEVKNILPKELPHICIFKRGSVLPLDGPNSHSQEATTEKPGKLWIPDTIALWIQGKEASSGKGLQLVKPIQAPHKEPKSRQRPLEGQAGRDPPPSLSSISQSLESVVL